jgi:hypothetical protein
LRYDLLDLRAAEYIVYLILSMGSMDGNKEIERICVMFLARIFVEFYVAV